MIFMIMIKIFLFQNPKVKKIKNQIFQKRKNPKIKKTKIKNNKPIRHNWKLCNIKFKQRSIL